MNSYSLHHSSGSPVQNRQSRKFLSRLSHHSSPFHVKYPAKTRSVCRIGVVILMVDPNRRLLWQSSGQCDVLRFRVPRGRSRVYLTLADIESCWEEKTWWRDWKSIHRDNCNSSNPLHTGHVTTRDFSGFLVNTSAMRLDSWWTLQIPPVTVILNNDRKYCRVWAIIGGGVARWTRRPTYLALLGYILEFVPWGYFTIASHKIIRVSRYCGFLLTICRVKSIAICRGPIQRLVGDAPCWTNGSSFGLDLCRKS